VPEKSAGAPCSPSESPRPATSLSLIVILQHALECARPAIVPANMTDS